MQIPPDNYPEEYTHGSVHFFGRDFIVTPDVLIPRLETECLIRRARKIVQPGTTIIDIGCGSGIIGSSIADLADEVIFLDISPEVLSITEKNFRTHFPDTRAQYIVSDLLWVFLDSQNLPSDPSTNLLFVTNLPYIKNEDWINMSADTIYEPKLALFWWEKTGFELYEKLFEQLLFLSQSNNQFSIHCIFEFWFDQREIAEQILNQYPDWKYSFFADYAGIERFGEITI